MQFGKDVKTWRKSKSMTQEQASSVFGVSRQTIINWERNLKYPALSKMKEVYEIIEKESNEHE